MRCCRQPVPNVAHFCAFQLQERAKSLPMPGCRRNELEGYLLPLSTLEAVALTLTITNPNQVPSWGARAIPAPPGRPQQRRARECQAVVIGAQICVLSQTMQVELGLNTGRVGKTRTKKQCERAFAKSVWRARVPSISVQFSHVSLRL